MSKMIGSISMPLDSDGFLRRACPHCTREFKWLHSERLRFAGVRREIALWFSDDELV